MEWYHGGIAEGVSLSRTNGSIFVVFIEGNDTKSKALIGVLNTAAISAMLRQPNFVAIRIEGDSVTHQQFAQIYKDSTAPSIYFIGKNGIALEIIKDAMDENQLRDKINEIVLKNGEPQSTSPEMGEEAPITEDVVVASVPTVSIDERMKLAQELIAKKRVEKEEEEKEKERNKEIERRRLGQDVQKMKRWQHEQTLKQLLDERQKAKREDQEARDRVLRQIEEDKREKAARMNINAPHVQQQSQEPPKTSGRPTNSSNTARLQLRMANGVSVTQEFACTARLQEVINFLSREHHQNNFTLSTTFPKREFNAQDAKMTLVELQLVPNSVILVIPRNRSAISNTGIASGGFVNMLMMVFSPIFGIFSYIRSFFFASPATGSSAEAASNRGPRSNEDIASGRKRSGSENNIRRRGNIHQLHEQDSDDENNTWNGNSTQQM